LFDEPATGLRFSDIEYLLNLFYQPADQGNTLLVIEHDPQIILNADWLIDLGPQGGDQGGYVVAQRPSEFRPALRAKSSSCVAKRRRHEIIPDSVGTPPESHRRKVGDRHLAPIFPTIRIV